MENKQTKVCYYVYDKKLVEVSKNIPNIRNRAAVVQSLIATYKLFEKCKLCPCEEATDEDLLSFHSSDYLNILKKAQISDFEQVSESRECLDFNLGYDCPLFKNIYTFAKFIAGSSLSGARKLVNDNFTQIIKKTKLGPVSQPKSYLKFQSSVRLAKENTKVDVPYNFTAEELEEVETSNNLRQHVHEVEVKCLESSVQPICINWFGGWHHAQRDEAGGFCYVNDIVIAIQYLSKFYRRVLYVDLDVHHGNGVENAFLFSQKVLTLSVHRYEPGFYPASGSVMDVGKGRGKFYSVNVPLKSGIRDKKYVQIFKVIFNKIMKRYNPDCIVVQCGADCLAGDPLGGFNLTLGGVGQCLKMILEEKLPTMVLGGGGYDIANTARCWAYLTSVILDCPLSDDIPENSFLHLYGPEFELKVSASLRKDENSDDYLNQVTTTILKNLDNVQH